MAKKTVIIWVILALIQISQTAAFSSHETPYADQHLESTNNEVYFNDLFEMMLYGPIIPALSSIPDVNIKIGISFEWFTGFTQYQIGGSFAPAAGAESERIFPLSELTFPIDVLLTSINLGIVFLDAFSFNATLKHNNLFGAHEANTHSGKMKDSDWGIVYLENNGAAWTDSSTLDIYSESDAYLTAIIFDFSFDFRFLKKKYYFMYIGCGILYQNLDYSVRNLDQWYPSYSRYSSYLSSDLANHDYVNGEVITYTVQYIIPYITLTPELNINEKFITTLKLGISPCASALDLDDHILRYKLSKGESLGFAFFINLSLNYRFHSNVSAGILFNFLYTYTWGTQTQEQYEYYDGVAEGSTVSIDNIIHTRQVSAGLNISFWF